MPHHPSTGGVDPREIREQYGTVNAWTLLVMLVATLVAIAVPLRLVLGAAAVPAFAVIDAALTILFVADVAVNFIVAKRAGAPYGMVLLATDLASALPFHAVWTPLLFLRMLKLGRVGAAMSSWRRQHLHRWNVLRLVYFVYWLGLSVHWLAMGWLALRGIPPGGDGWSMYLRSLYWCVATMTTVGYGDIAPSGTAEYVYAMVVMVFGVGMYGYVIANIATIIANLQPARALYLDTMEKLGAFMRYRGIPPSLQRRIRDYYGYVWEQRLGHDESSIVQGLPPGLRTEVVLFLRKDIIQKVPFFHGAAEELIREIALEMQPVVYTPGDYVFREGDPATDMFFISRGRLDVVAGGGLSVVATLADGEFFGEIALLHNQPRSAGVRARGYCDLYRLDKTNFDKVVVKFPEFATHIRAMSAGRRGHRR